MNQPPDAARAALALFGFECSRCFNTPGPGHGWYIFKRDNEMGSWSKFLKLKENASGQEWLDKIIELARLPP